MDNHRIFDYYADMTHSAHPLPFELRGGEKLLWSAAKVPHISVGQWVLWGLSGLFFVISGWFLVLGWLEQGIDAFRGMFYLIPGVLLIRVALLERARDRRTLYALSNQRAFIVEHAEGAAGVPLVVTFAVRPNMIIKYHRRRNGHADYYLGEESGYCINKRCGFINLPPEQEPLPYFALLGITLPATGETRRSAVFKRPGSRFRAGWGELICLCVLAAGIFLNVDECAFFLLSKETNGTVVSYRQGTKEVRKRGTVQLFYPEIEFCTADGLTCRAVSMHGYENYPAHQIGSVIPLRYLPGNPQLSSVLEQSELIVPVGCMVGLFVLIWFSWKEGSTPPPFGSPSYLLVDASETEHRCC